MSQFMRTSGTGVQTSTTFFASTLDGAIGAATIGLTGKSAAPVGQFKLLILNQPQSASRPNTMRQSLARSSCGCGLRDTRRSIGSGYAAPIKKTTAANNGISCLIVMQGTCPHLGQPWPLGGVTRRLRRCSGRYYPCFARLSFLHEPAHLFNGPVLACFDHTHP